MMVNFLYGFWLEFAYMPKRIARMMRISPFSMRRGERYAEGAKERERAVYRSTREQYMRSNEVDRFSPFIRKRAKTHQLTMKQKRKLSELMKTQHARWYAVVLHENNLMGGKEAIYRRARKAKVDLLQRDLERARRGSGPFGLKDAE